MIDAILSSLVPLPERFSLVSPRNAEARKHPDNLLSRARPVKFPEKLFLEIPVASAARTVYFLAVQPRRRWNAFLELLQRSCDGFEQ